MKTKLISLNPYETEVHQTIDLFCRLVVIEVGKVCSLNLFDKKLPSCLIGRFIIHLSYQSHRFQDELEVLIICCTIFTNRHLRKMDAV